jgi:hypothetical protein
MQPGPPGDQRIDDYRVDDRSCVCCLAESGYPLAPVADAIFEQ